MCAGLEPEQLYADGWSIGYDDRFPKAQRLQQALMFARLSEHDNLYAHPLASLFHVMRSSDGCLPTTH